jgi:glycosyltransferase involved in cell wall biosynthesis
MPMPLTVALDAQLALGTATGIGTYARDLAAALRADGVTVRALQAAWLDPWRFDRRVLWDQVVLPLQAARSGASLLHATAGTLPLVRTVPTVVTVHDMAWLRVQDHAPPYARAYFGGAMRRAYRGAAAVVVDSAFSGREYHDLSGDRRPPAVVPPGVDARFAALVRRPDAAPFALVTGTVERRKNLIRAIETAAAIPELAIVSIGPPTPYLDAARARARDLGVGERVRFLGYVERAVIDDLYARATLALVPSRYEGFGYALAEALCAGLPVVASDRASLPEVAAGDAALVDPDDAGGWIEAVRAVLADRDRAQRAAEAVRPRAVERFAWTHAARALRAVYARFAAQ